MVISTPPKLRRRVTLNTLKFLISAIPVWMDILASRSPPGSSFLAETDRTACVGWLHKINFNTEDKQAQLQTTRTFAELLMDSGSCIYYQPITRSANRVTDSLSRDHNLDDAEPTAFLQLSPPQHMPLNFELKPVPNEISSFVTAVTKDLPVTNPSSSTSQGSTQLIGPDGSNIPNPSELKICSYLPFH
jgi:hypothetical protein